MPFFKTQGISLYYEIRKARSLNQDPIPIIFLHGAGGNSFLTEAIYKVIDYFTFSVVFFFTIHFKRFIVKRAELFHASVGCIIYFLHNLLFRTYCFN